MPPACSRQVVSGRACFELVQKAVTADIPMLAAVSAPRRWLLNLQKKLGCHSWKFSEAPR